MRVEKFLVSEARMKASYGPRSRFINYNSINMVLSGVSGSSPQDTPLIIDF
jgi:hypothetical protein